MYQPRCGWIERVRHCPWSTQCWWTHLGFFFCLSLEGLGKAQSWVWQKKEKTFWINPLDLLGPSWCDSWVESLSQFGQFARCSQAWNQVLALIVVMLAFFQLRHQGRHQRSQRRRGGIDVIYCNLALFHVLHVLPVNGVNDLLALCLFAFGICLNHFDLRLWQRWEKPWRHCRLGQSDHLCKGISKQLNN